MLYPGPHYDIEQDFRSRLELLSQGYCGEVWTFGPVTSEHRFGDFEVRCVEVPERRFAFKLLRLSLAALRNIRRKRREGTKVDLIVSYDPAAEGLLGLLYAWRFRAKVLIEVNGDYCDLENYTDLGEGLGTTLRRKAFVAVAKFVLKRADGIRLLYPTQLEPYELQLDRTVIRSFFDFVDLRPFRNLGEEKVVLFVGFPFHRKGIDLLIEAFKRVSDRHPDWNLVILGFHPNREQMDSHIDGHARIVHKPPVHHREMPSHIGRAGIVVLPSRSEAMGRVLLEAMQAGKPRIGARVGGIPSVVDDGRDGLLIQKDSVTELSEAMDRLMSNAELRHGLGRQGQERAERDYTLARYYELTDELYTSVLAGEAIVR